MCGMRRLTHMSETHSRRQTKGEENAEDLVLQGKRLWPEIDRQKQRRLAWMPCLLVPFSFFFLLGFIYHILSVLLVIEYTGLCRSASYRVQWQCLSPVCCGALCYPRGRLGSTMLCVSLCLQIWFGHLHRCWMFPSHVFPMICAPMICLFLGCSAFTFCVGNRFCPFISTQWCAGLFSLYKLVSAYIVTYPSCIQVPFCTQAGFCLELLLTKNKTAYNNNVVITLFSWLPNTHRENKG